MVAKTKKTTTNFSQSRLLYPHLDFSVIIIELILTKRSEVVISVEKIAWGDKLLGIQKTEADASHMQGIIRLAR